jgi:hypothetical protein
MRAGGFTVARREHALSVKANVTVSLDEILSAILAMKDEDREWFIENLLAATNPEYLQSIEEARQDYREGRTVPAEELFGDALR